jgi:hypothetical protein
MEKIQLAKANIATTGLTNYDKRGTIAIDFANYFDKLADIKNININQFIEIGYIVVGLRLDADIFFKDKIDEISIDIVFQKKQNDEKIENKFVKRKISKNDFITMVVRARIQLSYVENFWEDNTDWNSIEEMDEQG